MSNEGLLGKLNLRLKEESQISMTQEGRFSCEREEGFWEACDFSMFLHWLISRFVEEGGDIHFCKNSFNKLCEIWNHL